jgi:hypothetical protein
LYRQHDEQSRRQFAEQGRGWRVNVGKLHDWLQIVGLFGVIASLIFVGLQLKQDRDIAIAAAYQARTSSASDSLASIADNPVVIRALAKAEYGDPQTLVHIEGFAAELTAEELMAAQMSINSMATLIDNSYYQYQAGFLPEDHWLAVRNLVKAMISRNPLWRAGLSTRPNNRRPEFNDMMDALLEEIDAEQRGTPIGSMR